MRYTKLSLRIFLHSNLEKSYTRAPMPVRRQLRKGYKACVVEVIRLIGYGHHK